MCDARAAACGGVCSRELVRTCAGVRTHALSWCCGQPSSQATPLVLLHGFSQSARTWAGVGPRLARALPGSVVLAPEFVGHGGSSRGHDPAAYGLDALVRTLSAFVEDVALAGSGAGRVGLVGYSMGGRVAAVLACERPELLSWLVLESAGLGPADDPARAEAALRDERVARRLRSEPLATFMDFWEALPVFDSQRGLPEGRRRALRAARMANDPQCLALTVEGSGQHAMPRVAEGLAALPLDVLYLAGELDEKYAGVARSFGAMGPRVRVRVVARAGHDVHFEDEETFCAEVALFAAAHARKDVPA